MRPPPGQRQASLTREQIALAATKLVEEEGVRALSMRRIAQALGVGTMTLYHYVSTKDELLQLIDDSLMAELVIPDAELPADDWRAAMTMIAMRTRAVLRRHPWGVSAAGGLASPGPPGPNAVRHFEQSLAAATATGLEPEERFEVVTLIDDYVFGYSLRARAHDAGAEPPESDMIAFVQRTLANADFPQLASLFPPGASVVDAWRRFEAIEQDESRFTRGLERLLDGIALDLERRNLT